MARAHTARGNILSEEPVWNSRPVCCGSCGAQSHACGDTAEQVDRVDSHLNKELASPSKSILADRREPECGSRTVRALAIGNGIHFRLKRTGRQSRLSEFVFASSGEQIPGRASATDLNSGAGLKHRKAGGVSMWPQMRPQSMDGTAPISLVVCFAAADARLQCVRGANAEVRHQGNSPRFTSFESLPSPVPLELLGDAPALRGRGWRRWRQAVAQRTPIAGHGHHRASPALPGADLSWCPRR